MTTLNLPSLWEEAPEKASGAEKPLVVDDLPTQGSIPRGQVFVIRNHESRYLTHTFHKYAGKFIPQIPRWAMRRHLRRNEGAVVLDPFVGSGTTLVECLLEGHRGFGVDIDPLARLIAKVKTTLIPARRLLALPAEVDKRLAKRRRGKFRPAIPTLNHWFTEKAVEDLSVIYDVVEAYRAESDVYDFLLICFSSIVRRASNADNQTMKTYVSHTHAKTPEPARVLFGATVYEYAQRLVKLSELVAPNGSATIDAATDARSIDRWTRGRKRVDLAITSPPYIKSVDYIYNQMAELFWIGDRWGLETQSKQNEFKKQYVGTDRITAPEAAATGGTGLDRIDSFVSRIRSNDAGLGAVASRYFTDMLGHFAAMKKILKSDGKYVMVVGDSTLAGVAVPTHDLLIECARQAGFDCDLSFAYEIRNKHMRFPRAGRGGEVHHDWIVELSPR